MEGFAFRPRRFCMVNEKGGILWTTFPLICHR
jgi:hypothetical protein